MKKYLAILGLLAFVSAPAFAQCATCNPCLPQAVAVPIVTPYTQYVTGAACPVNPCNPCVTGAACPVNTCDPCMTGAAYPINPCNVCDPCERKGFWSRFLGY